MKKVLLPIDGTRRSLQTVDWLKDNYKPDEVKHSSDDELVDLGYKVDYETAYGNPGEEIVKYAKKEKFDAIIMTKSTKDGWFSTIGSVTTYCVKYADTVVMIIPEKHS